jgi:hypothetical protein
MQLQALLQAIMVHTTGKDSRYVEEEYAAGTRESKALKEVSKGYIHDAKET